MIKLNDKNLCEHCFSEIEENADKCPNCSSEKNNSKYPTALPEGTILAGRYVVGRVLGKGGFGITYLCYDTRENKTVAIKEYLPDHLTHRNTGETHVSTYSGETEEYFRTGAQKFFEEAKLVSNFNGNPNIISVYEFFYENNTTYFVMEYLDGVDLKTYIKQKGGKIPEGEALYIAEKVIQALMIVHSTNILHRDISPDNIFICSDGKIKLIDFGAARQVMGEVSKSLSVVLKEGFAPIEQYQTRGKQGPWTDIYALGATLYYSLTGEVLDNAMTRMTDDSQMNLNSVSPEFANILTKMLEIKKEDRYQDTIELKKDITALTETVPPPPPPPPVDPWYKKFVKKIRTLFTSVNKKKLIAIASSVAVVIISVIVAVYVSNKNNVTESSGGNVSGNGTPTLNGTINVNDFTEENKTSATKENKTKADKEEKTTKKKTSTTKKKTSTTKKRTSTTKKSTQKLSFKNRYDTLSAGATGTIGIKSDGTVIATEDWARIYDCDLSGWENIIAVAAGNQHLVGLKSNGTVVATGKNSAGQCNTSGWKNIVSIAAGYWHTVGLKSDGTVVSVGNNNYDHGQCDVSNWKNIVAVSAGCWHTVGLKSNGTVVATGWDTDGQCNVSGWRNIVAVSAGEEHTVGLKSDGTVVAVGSGYDSGAYDVSRWRNIVAVSAGYGYTIGLKSDGTVVVAGRIYGGPDLSSWKNIVAVDAADKFVVGLKSDGTVIAAGSSPSDLEKQAMTIKNIKIPK